MEDKKKSEEESSDNDNELPALMETNEEDEIESAITTLKNAPDKKNPAVMGFVVECINECSNKDGLATIRYKSSGGIREKTKKILDLPAHLRKQQAKTSPKSHTTFITSKTSVVETVISNIIGDENDDTKKEVLEKLINANAYGL